MKKISKILSLMMTCVIVIAISFSNCNTITVYAKTADYGYDPHESTYGIRVRYFPIEDDITEFDEETIHQICQSYLDEDLPITRNEGIDRNQNHLVVMAATLCQLDEDMQNYLANDRLKLVLNLDSFRGDRKKFAPTKKNAHLTTLQGDMTLYKVKRSIFGNDRLSTSFFGPNVAYSSMSLNSSKYAHYEVNLLYCFPADYTKGRTENYYVLSDEPIDIATSDTSSIQISKASDLKSYRKYICIYELLWRTNEDENETW